MKKNVFLLAIFCCPLACAHNPEPSTEGSLKAIQVLQRLKAERDIDVTVNRSGEKKKMKIQTAQGTEGTLPNKE